MPELTSLTDNAVDPDRTPRGRRLNTVVASRLLLREYQLTDADEVWEAIEESRGSLTRWVPTIGRQSSADTVRKALYQLSGVPIESRLSLSLWERNSGRFVGEVGLYDVELQEQVAEVGYWLRESARGRGYATEALASLKDHAVRAYALRQLIAYVPTENIASRRVLGRLGFQVAAHCAAVGPGHAETTDMLRYALDIGAGQSSISRRRL